MTIGSHTSNAWRQKRISSELGKVVQIVPIVKKSVALFGDDTACAWRDSITCLNQKIMAKKYIECANMDVRPIFILDQHSKEGAFIWIHGMDELL